MRHVHLLAFVLSTTICGGCFGAVDSTEPTSTAPTPRTDTPPSESGVGSKPSSQPSDGKDATNVLGVLDGSYVESMTADATTLYLGRDCEIFAIPKSGGTPKKIFSEKPENRSTTRGIAVDDTHVYFSGGGGRIVSRVPKSGGVQQSEVLVQNADYPHAIAIDGTHLYVALNGTGRTKAEATGAIIRLPKAGGVIEQLATNQFFPDTITLHDEHVYFSTDGAIVRVAKNGGPVNVLTKENENVGQARELVVSNDRVYWVGPTSHALTFVPVTGGASTAAGPSTLEELVLTSDGTSFFAMSFAAGMKDASLVALDASGSVSATLASWTYGFGKPSSASPDVAFAYAATASVTDATHIYWVDYQSDSQGHRRATVRAAKK